MPDANLPIANQLDQAMNIIRDHIKLLAEAKIHTEASKKTMKEFEEKIRRLEHDVCVRDKAIAELRLRLPATSDRDHVIAVSLNNQQVDNVTPARAAQATIEALQVFKAFFGEFLLRVY